MTEVSQDSPPAPLLAPGERVDHFEVIRVLGHGGMGEVYLARDTRLGRKVALKVVRARSFDDRRSLDRFLYEARVTARFNHPNIVTVYSVDEHEGHPYLALEYLEGDTLRQRMARGRLEPRQSLEIGLAVARALAEAHRHHILHRDLKPENVALPRDGRVRVLDFGLARAAARPDVAVAASGAASAVQSGLSLFSYIQDEEEGGFTGTPYYMAPEQWQSEPATEASDVWGLGVILFEMLSGERPFTGPTIFLLGAKIVSNDPSPPLPHAEQVPRELAALVSRCIDKDAARRPRAEQVAAELERLLQEGPRPRRFPRWALWALGGVSAAALAVLLALYAPDWNGDAAHGMDRDRPPAPRRDAGAVDQRFPLRMASSRDTLRAGTTELDTILGSEVAPAIFWGLLHHEPDGQVTPVLVDEVPSPDNGGARPAPEGGFEVTWRLRPALRWSDGHPLSASDLAFALEVYPVAHLVEAHAPDARTLVVRWDDQVAVALGSIRPLPRHVLAGIFAEGGARAVTAHMQTRPTPVVGPYRVTEFVSNERMLLDANPHFVGPPPSIARVTVVRAAPDELGRRFEAHELDVLLPDALSLQQAEGLADRRPEAVHIRPSTELVVLQPDMDHPLLQRRPVRQAVLQAIDRGRLVTEVFGSEGRIAHVPQLSPLPEGIEQYRYEPDQAAAVLGQLEDRTMPIPLLHSAGDTERRVAAQVARDLEAVGLRITDREASLRDTRAAFRQRRHDGLLLGSLRVTRRANPLPFMNLPHRDSTFDTSVRHDGFNDRMAALIEQEARALSGERQAELRDSLWTAYSRRLPLIPLVFAAECLVIHPALRGWDEPPSDRLGRGLEGWYFVNETSKAPARPGDDTLDD